MKRTLPILLLLINISLGFAQRSTPQFGVLTDAEKNMMEYAPEPEAAAVVLFDIGDSYFFDSPDGGYDIRFTRTKRIKILTRAGLEHAQVSIQYYEENATRKEKITSLEAYTYVLRDGLTYKKTLDPKTVFEEQITPRVKAKKFAFPDVQEGAIIEYKYVLETPFQFRLPDWTFQTNIPTLYSEYTVSMIPFYEYVFIAQGIAKFDYQNSAVSKKQRAWGVSTDALGRSGGAINFNDMVHTYAMRNVPSFQEDEAYITSSEDYIMKMDFQMAKFNRPSGGSENIITTWPALNKELLKEEESFGKYLNAASRGAKKILEKEIPLTPDMGEEKKIEAIVSYVRSHYKWNEYRGLMASKSYKEFAEQRNGNITDINLFLTAMLQAAGINAEPVILSTRRNGKIRTDYPFSHYFDAVVVLVSGQRTMIVDGTEDLLAYDRIPIRCINEKGLVVAEDKESVRWIGLEPRIPSIEGINLNFTVDPANAKAIISGQISATEYEGYEYRRGFKNDSTAFRKHLEERHQMEPSRVTFLNYDKPKLPYAMQFTGSVALEKVGNKLIVQPFLAFPHKENPFVKPTRSYPVDFIFPRTTIMRAVIKIPDGYKPGPLPEPDATDNELAKVTLNFIVSGNSLEVQADLILKKSTYPSSDYNRLRNIYITMVKGFNQSIVLEKL